MRSRFSLLFIGLALSSKAIFAQEVCGLQQAKFDQPELIFRNGFEGAAQTASVAAGSSATPAAVSQSKGTGLGPAITTVSAPVLGVTPTITISAPLANASIARTLQVQGTFTGPANTGITVMGVPATIIGNQFVSEPLQLDAGSTEIIVRAKTMDGLSASQARIVSVTAPPAQDFTIALSSRIGFAPFRTKPRIAVSGITAVQSIAIDFNGDGADDYTGSAQNIPIYTYANPGVYRMRVVLTAGAQSYTRFRTLAVPGLPEVRAQACAVYAHLRARLAANDSPGALQAIAQPMRDSMAELFTALGTNRPAFAARLGTMANGIFTPTDAEIVLVNEVGTNVEGTAMHLVRGADGIWRIDSL